MKSDIKIKFLICFIDEVKEFDMGCIRCSSDILRIEHTCGLRRIVKEAADRFDALPLYRASSEARAELNIVERVTPAAIESQHVEQQTEEQDVQLPAQIKGES